MADSDQLSNTRLLCKLNDLRTQMACISARPNNSKTEQDFRATCPLYQNKNHTSDPFISQTYQELAEKYHQITSLYIFGELDRKAHLFTYNIENEREEAKLIKTPIRLDTNGASIVQLPNGELFCNCKKYRGFFITFVINKNYELRMLPSQKSYRCITAVYYRGNVYCFGEDEDSETLSYRFDLYRNLWFKLTPLPYHCPYCNSAVFNKNIFISEPSSKNILQYSIDIDSFSIIPYDFQSDCRKVLLNGEERLYLIEWTKNGFIYESGVGDEYNWKQIAKSAKNQNCSQLYWIYNKRGIYISTLSKKCVREYYKFDLDQNAFIDIAYYDKHIAIRELGGRFEAIDGDNQTFNLNPQAALSFGKFTIHDVGRKLEKIECYNEAIKLNPADYYAYNNKGNTLSDLERYLEAIECFDEAIKVDPMKSYAYDNKGISLNALKRYNEALECYNEALEINSNIPEIYIDKGETLCNLNRNAEAIECYEESIKLDPKLEIAHYWKGCAYFRLGWNRDAIKCFDEVLKLDPHYAIAYDIKGRAHYRLHNYLEAIDCYNESIKFDPNYAYTYIDKGDAFCRLNRNIEAFECYNEAIKIDPRDDIAYIKKGYIFFELKRYLEAIECYNEAIKLDPDNPLNFFDRARALNSLGQEAEALQDFYRGYYLTKESQKSNDAKFNLSQINSNFTNLTLKNDIIELLQKLAHLQESAIGFKKQFNCLKDTKNQKLIKKVEEQEEKIKKQHSKFLMKAAGLFSPKNYDTQKEMQEKIYKINREIDEHLKRIISKISNLILSLSAKHRREWLKHYLLGKD